MFDLLIRGGRLPDSGLSVDIGISKGLIVEIGPELTTSAQRVIDATGRLVAPPFIDPHFHMDATLTLLLSGGNMQKLIHGRNLAAAPRFLRANQPTRGLDVGAIVAVHAELLAARAAGAAIFLISEDLEEASALSDRIQAIVKGRLSRPITSKAADARTLGLIMAGVWGAEDAV